MSTKVNSKTNVIKHTRGDTMMVRVKIEINDEEYTPVTGDTVRFALKHTAMNSGKTDYSDREPLILKDVPISTMILTLEPEDTKSLGFGDYEYDMELTYANGVVLTFIEPTKFTLDKEVH